MRKSYAISMLFAAVVLCVVPVIAHASPVFYENFNELTDSYSATSVGQFQTINGTNVDIVGPGNGWGWLCSGAEGGSCIDLGGSNGNAYGDLQTVSAINLAPGNYVLSFDLNGDQRGYGNTTTDVTLGALISTSFTLGDAATTVQTIPFTVLSPTSAYLEFVYTDGANPNVGSVLDNVSINMVPEPGTLTLFGSGILGLAAAIRRRMGTKN